MGSSVYNTELRSERAFISNYAKASVNEIFTQNNLRTIHESMEPKKALIRESRDSETHPNSVPIIIALDVTGSMGKIPHHLIKDGLPTLMSGIIQNGIPDPQVLFLAVGDVTCDLHPLQVGQFESGDEELDMWLTRTYLEGGGGGNDGESYQMAWHYASNHTITDAWEKRNQKGFLFTIGDEPIHSSFTKKYLNEIFGQDYQGNTKNEDLLEDAQKMYNVYHIHVAETSSGRRSLGFWKNLMGQHCISVESHTEIPKVIANIVSSNVVMPNTQNNVKSDTEVMSDMTDEEKMLL